jgi:predicted DCC family thiol-disulfide oxidoreductase YuxK
MIDGEVSPGLSKTQALSRFYTLDENGNLASGGKAFTSIWEILPRFRPLAMLFRIQPFAWLLDCAYSLFLKFRPSLQTMVRNRQTRCE